MSDQAVDERLIVQHLAAQPLCVAVAHAFIVDDHALIVDRNQKRRPFAVTADRHAEYERFVFILIDLLDRRGISAIVYRGEVRLA